MLMEIETALLEADCLRLPCVYIRPDVDKQLASKVKDLVISHQGEVAGMTCIEVFFNNWLMIVTN